jgi:hypothetical protein
MLTEGETSFIWQLSRAMAWPDSSCFTKDSPTKTYGINMHDYV